MSVVYFDQLSGAVLTQKLVKTLFGGCFQTFSFNSNIFSDFTAEIKLKTAPKKCFDQLLGWRSTRKLVKIHNRCPYTEDGLLLLELMDLLGL